MKRNTVTYLLILILTSLHQCLRADDTLIGNWKLDGDCEDHSGHFHHGINHGVDLTTGAFNGMGDYIEVANAPELQLSDRPFSLVAWVQTDKDMRDVIGDVLSKYDPSRRKGFNLSISGSAPGYNSMCNARYLQFGLDNASAAEWTDCGRPGGKTNNSDALTVFRGHLYAGITDAPDRRTGPMSFDTKATSSGKTVGASATDELAVFTQ
jgi:hypothetical protein